MAQEKPPEDATATKPDAEAHDEVTTLRQRAGVLEKQVSDYKLLVAELQTSARRLREDADKQKKYASESFAADMLGAYDNLERALGEARKAGETGPLIQGVSACLDLFVNTLKRHGVQKIETTPGSNFDPNHHLAVMQQPTNDYDPGTVFLVLQQGFTFHDRVLRPATVIVASEPPAGSICPTEGT